VVAVVGGGAWGGARVRYNREIQTPYPYPKPPTPTPNPTPTTHKHTHAQMWSQPYKQNPHVHW
jgi:hypothetical protein